MVKFANGRTIAVSPRHLKINESVNEEVELTFESIFSRADGSPETTGQMISRWASKTVKKGQYDQVAKYIRNKMEKEKGNNNSAEFHAAEIIRKTGLKLDPKALALVVRNENADPVKIAHKEIDREKEQDKVRHDRILDRARLARAKQKNRETKP